MRSKSMRRANADAPAMISFGFFLRERFERVVIDVFLRVQAVADHVEPLAAHVQRHAVCQVAAFGQAHAHDRVARLEHGEEHTLVGLRARVRLYVGGFGAKQLLHAVDGELLDHVHIFATAVVTLAGVALGVLVGQLRALRGHHGRRGVVLRGDQLDVVFLTLIFLLDGGKDFGIDLVDRIAAAFEHGECLGETKRNWRRSGEAGGHRETRAAWTTASGVGRRQRVPKSPSFPFAAQASGRRRCA